MASEKPQIDSKRFDNNEVHRGEPRGILANKIKKLESMLKSYPGVVVAFSGGVDSTLLLIIARSILRDKVIAVTAYSPIYPINEVKSAKKIARLLNVKHILINSKELQNRDFVRNTSNRCYHCKMALFSRICKIARKYGYAVLEGSNRSDLSDYRPGIKAARKMGVVSPFINAGITKDEIRMLGKVYGLPNWNKPSTPCLASRIPYGTKIDRKVLSRIGRAERYLSRSGLTQVRVRDHFPIARIEVMPHQLKKIIRLRHSIITNFKKLGYDYVTLDLAGYRTGSMNITLGVKS